MPSRSTAPRTRPLVLWFRDDLRIADNPALLRAAEEDAPVICLFVLDDESESLRPIGAASRFWLHHSLESLAADLGRLGHKLILRRGPAARVVPAVAQQAKAAKVLWNRRYGHARTVDDAVEQVLAASGVAVETFKANLLFEPDELRSRAGEPFRAFAGFRRAFESADEPRAPLPAPKALTPFTGRLASDKLAAFELVPTAPDWTAGVDAAWKPGEAGATQRLRNFLAGPLADYEAQRDEPAADGTARLSPHLRFGEVSPFQIRAAIVASDKGPAPKFLSELVWREFAYHVLAQLPDLATDEHRPEFVDFPYAESYADDMWDWRRGNTGYPIVDAGMRQLWQTGWMHNRVRMITASFLAKHLLAEWRIGEEWFWDTLVDADPASNPFNWQWIAGSGVDAQPFFRIFNPVLQGEKFDAGGGYVRRFVPELARLPDRYVHRPFEAPEEVLKEAGVTLGRDYPLPLVEHSAARERALEAFARIRPSGEKSVA